jgi:hypothetical protein
MGRRLRRMRSDSLSIVEETGGSVMLAIQCWLDAAIRSPKEHNALDSFGHIS